MIFILVFNVNAIYTGYYIFYDDMDSGSVAGKYVGNELAYSSVYNLSGNASLRLTSDTDVNLDQYINTSLFNIAGNPFCMNFYYYLDGISDSTNNDVGILFDDDTSWDAELAYGIYAKTGSSPYYAFWQRQNESVNPYPSGMAYTYINYANAVSNVTKSWKQGKVCALSTLNLSNSTFLFYGNHNETGQFELLINGSQRTKSGLWYIFFHNRQSANTSRDLFLDNISIWRYDIFGINPPSYLEAQNPDFNITYPLNETYNNATLQINFTCSNISVVSISYTNISLYGSDKILRYNFGNITSGYKFNTLLYPNGDYYISGKCVDILGFSSNISNSSLFTLDNADPVGVFIVPDLDNSTTVYNVPGSDNCFDMIFTDNHLIYSVNFTITGNNTYNNYTSGIDLDSYIFDPCFDFTNESDNITMNWSARYCDAHTASLLDDLDPGKVITSKDEIWMKADYSVKVEGAIDTSISSKDDKIEMTYYFEKPVKEIDMTINADKIHWVNSDMFNCWAIIDDKYWFDCEGFKGLYEYGNNTIHFISYEEISKLELRSTGELNCVNRNGTFLLRDIPYINQTLSNYTCPDTIESQMALWLIALLLCFFFVMALAYRIKILGMVVSLAFMPLAWILVGCYTLIAMMIWLIAILSLLHFIVKGG